MEAEGQEAGRRGRRRSGRAGGHWYGQVSWDTLVGRAPVDAWQGDPKRNEDALSVEPHDALFGVYDGTLAPPPFLSSRRPS
jgi:hypothetical protein